MKPDRSNSTIWLLAFGYFACYIPYSSLTKLLTKGDLTSGIAVPGFELLPATVIATSLTFLFTIVVTRGWRHCRCRSVAGVPIPVPRWQTLISGTATAVIIATTTLNYTFPGISILFALLLMRGGVLILAPITDRVLGRPVHWQSWAAFGFSLAAVLIALANLGGYDLTTIAVLNLACYLMGYVFRLYFMTRIAKSTVRQENQRYFIEETAVAALMLTTLPALVALVGSGEIAEQLRTGFTTFLAGPLLLPALAIGFCYASLYYFGSCIYLDHRENTFCIPLNRCSSLLSGVVASFALAILWGHPLPTAQQFLGVGLIVAALLILSSRSLLGLRAATPAQFIILFVCGGNTSRSPMARMICMSGIAKRLGAPLASLTDRNVHVHSAGLSATPGAELAANADLALQTIGAPRLSHAAQNATAEMVQEANVVFCMTQEQHEILVERFPDGAGKVRKIDPQGDIGNPDGQGFDAYLNCAKKLQHLIEQQLDELAIGMRPQLQQQGASQ